MSARRPAPVYKIHWVVPPTPEQRSALVDDCLPLFAEALRVARRMEEGSRGHVAGTGGVRAGGADRTMPALVAPDAAGKAVA